MASYPPVLRTAHPALRGFTCPNCYRPLISEISKNSERGQRLRARLCPQCGFARLTCERIVHGDELLAGVRGFVCIDHTRPLDVTHVIRAAPDIIVRYLECPACPERVRPQFNRDRSRLYGPRCRPKIRTEERSVPSHRATRISVLQLVCDTDA